MKAKIKKYQLDIFLAIVLVVVLLIHYGDLAGAADNILLITVSIIGMLPTLWGAIRSFRQGEWGSMDLLASVALVFSLLSGHWASAVFIELMLTSARILDDLTRDRTEKNMKWLLKLRPETAQVEFNGVLVEKGVEEIKVGDIVVIGLGERIPIDGIVISGNAAIDESSLTGESLPVEKGEGKRVLSSTVVQSGNLRIKTTHTGLDTTLERVIKLVESAREEKPPFQSLAEKFGKIYLVLILLGSALLYVATQNLTLVLAVVLVVCADDIAIAIPIAYLRAIQSAASIGVIVKGGKHLEIFGRVGTVIFDKTGTLTTGKLVVNEIVAAVGFSEDEVLKATVLADVRSSHPMSRAVVAYAKKKGVPEIFPDSAEEKGGKGVVARKGKDVILVGKRNFLEESGVSFPVELLDLAAEKAAFGQSVSFVSKNKTALGFAVASDQIKNNAKGSIEKLRMMGVKKIVMLTGDNGHAAATIAKKLKIDEWHADLLPENKVEIIKQIQKNSLVAMVGDGVNDAAALSVSNVGIAMGGLGAEGTVDSAQIVLMRDDLSTLPETMEMARLVRKISVQDFWIWGITNAAGLLLVFGGIIGPSGAAAYNFLSDFLPLFNSVRIKHNHHSTLRH